jgi:hypothetical protein
VQRYSFFVFYEIYLHFFLNVLKKTSICLVVFVSLRIVNAVYEIFFFKGNGLYSPDTFGF